jgi:hypothetical protein
MLLETTIHNAELLSTTHTILKYQSIITMVSSKGLQPLRSATRSIGALPAACASAQSASRRYAGTLASFKIPTVNNEPNVSELLSKH